MDLPRKKNIRQEHLSKLEAWGAGGGWEEKWKSAEEVSGEKCVVHFYLEN